MARALGVLYRSKTDVANDLATIQRNLVALSEEAERKITPLFPSQRTRDDFIAARYGGNSKQDAAAFKMIDAATSALEKIRRDFDILLETSFDENTQRRVGDALRIDAIMVGSPRDNYKQFLITHEELKKEVDNLISRLPHYDEPHIAQMSALQVPPQKPALSDVTKRSEAVESATLAKDTQMAEIAIITILPEEYEAVKRRMKNVRRDPGTRDNPNRYAWVVGEIDSVAGGTHSVVLAMTVHPGNVSSSLGITKTVDRWHPRYVLLVGIAGGLPRDSLALGDVVVSTQICSYEYGKIDHNAFNPRPNFLYQVDGALLSNAVSLSLDAEWHKDVIPRPMAGGVPRVLHGMVGSGEKVVDDRSAAFFAAVEKVFPKLQAVEMEGAGAAAAIEEYQRIGFLMIRGISDIPPKDGTDVAAESTDTGGKDRDRWKKYAADVAASFATYFIANAWPMPPKNSGIAIQTGLFIHGQPDSGAIIAKAVPNAVGDAQEEQCVSAYRDVLAAIAALRAAGEQLKRDHDWNQAQQHEMYAPTIKAIKRAFDTIECRRFDMVPSFVEAAKRVVEYWEWLTDIFWEHRYLDDIDPPLDAREAGMLDAIPISYRVRIAPGYFQISQ